MSVYAHDGTVSVNIGGVEMGQGLNTKMLQIAAYTLNVPFDFIEVGTTSTEKVNHHVQLTEWINPHGFDERWGRKRGEMGQWGIPLHNLKKDFARAFVCTCVLHQPIHT